MAKKRFDRAQAIGESVKLFWQYGYKGASMQQVFECTGLKPGSVYLAFGNKEGLFQESVEHYTAQCLEEMSEVLSTAETASLGVCQVFRNMINVAQAEDFCSCFLVKCRLELPPEKQELHHFIDQQLEKIQNLFEYHLTKEYSNLNEADDLVKYRAKRIMMQMYGIQVYGYHKDCRQDLLAGVRESLPWLPWDGETKNIVHH